MWNDNTYEFNYKSNELERNWETGAELGEVKYMLNGNAGVNHKTVNGDAAFLSPGTKLYEMKGYDPGFRIIANDNVYEVNEPETLRHLVIFLISTKKWNLSGF